MVEGLAGLIRQAVKANLLSGIKIGSKEVELCFLQFADDTLFLYKNTFNNVVTLKAILMGFELASGLKINFHKSKLTSINVQQRDIDYYTMTLNCAHIGILFNYLGIGRFLSMAGRICLIKSVITVEDGCCPFKIVFDEDLYVHFICIWLCFKCVLGSA